MSGSTAHVVWREELLMGCEFIDAVPTRAVSSGRLVSAIETREQPDNVLLPIVDPPRERRYGSPVDGTETTVVIVTGLMAMVAVVIPIAAILTLL